MNNVIDTINNRTSLRSFADKHISDETKSLLFDCGIKAPTAGNQMMYTMLDITSQELKDKLAVLCDNQPFIAKAPMVVVYIADLQKWFDYFSQNGVKKYCENSEDLVFEAPQESDLMLACQDAMCAAENMVLAAESIGIGSCYIGDILENYEEIRELLNLPDWGFPISMLVFGYPKENHKKVFRQRFDPKYVVFENTYKNLNNDEIEDMFSFKSDSFKAKGKLNADNHAQFFYARKTGAEFSREMARSVRVAMKRWDGRKL